MRVRVIGDMDAAAVLRGYLVKDGTVALWKEGDPPPDCTVTLESGEGFYFDSIDCPLEDSIFRHVRDLAQSHIEIRTKGGVQSDNAIRIVFPASESRAIELGVLRGFADFAGPKRSVADPATPFVSPAPAYLDDSRIADLQQAHDRLVEEMRTASQSQLEAQERLLQAARLAHEETKTQTAATLTDANATIDSLNKENSDLAERVRVAESAAAGAAQLEDFYSRLIAQKDEGHSRLVEEIRAACQTAIAERDKLAEDLKAAKSAITPGAADGLVRELETTKAFYERMLSEKNLQLQQLQNLLTAAPLPWWKRIFKGK